MRVIRTKRERTIEEQIERPAFRVPEMTDKTKLTVFDYSQGSFNEWIATSPDQCVPAPENIAVRWINIDGLHNVNVVDRVCANFGLHPLTVEDLINTDQQPKVELTQEYAVVLVRMFRFGQDNSDIISEQVGIVFGQRFVLSFQMVEGDVFDPVRRGVREQGSHIRNSGADFLAYSLIDAIADHYFAVLDEISEDIERTQEKLITNPTANTLRHIYVIKRRNVELRRYTWPVREIAVKLEREGGQLCKKTTLPYLRDLYDHIIQVTDHIEIYREWLSSMLDIYLSSITNRLNEVIKLLTVVSTIAIPPTLIGSWYGMNFRYMPELNEPLFYPLLLIITAAISVSMFLMFRRKHWI